jgi:CHAD domain-containing protein
VTHRSEKSAVGPFESAIVNSANEPRRQAPIGDGQGPRPAAELAQSLVVRRALTRLLRKRIKKFVALAPEVGAKANPETVHDVAVWSRRLQQAISAFFPKPRSGEVRRLRRTPRRTRRALGEWRNYDVLLEVVARREQRTRSEAKRQAWAFVRDYLLAKRDKEVARAGKKLLRQELRDYASLANRLLGQPPEESPELLLPRLSASVRRASTEWQAALSRAQETRATNDLHAFRIATKDLRYRTELLFDLGHGELKAQLKWLAGLQEALGIWHDRQVLDRAVAEAIARAEILLNDLKAARILLAELETDRCRAAQDIERIFQLAMAWNENR